MAKVLTYSTTYPSYHHMRGTPTFFVEKFYNSLGIRYWLKLKYLDIDQLNSHLKTDLVKPFHYSLSSDIDSFKNHTIRKGKRFKKGDYFSPRVWGNDINPKSGKSGPYHSQQIILAPDTLITDVWDFSIREDGKFYLDGKEITPQSGLLMQIAKNDGLPLKDLMDWFKYPKPFEGQIICWNKQINYYFN